MSGFRNKLKAVFRDRASVSARGDGGQTVSRTVPLQPYWAANFSLEGKVSDEWLQEQGDHGWGNNELQNYTASDENAFFRGKGNVSPRLVLRANVLPGRATSARLTSKTTLGRDEGYLCARITAPSARGVWPAFWLLPSEPFLWPNDGEVDIMESWNDEMLNHSCLHWGQHNNQDQDKHRVVRTTVNDLNRPSGRLYGFAWHQRKGNLVWYVDGTPVMQSSVPRGIRRIGDFQIKLNIALGGNVCSGVKPADGVYEMEVHDMGMYEGPPGGWNDFESRLRHVPDGRP